MLLTALGLFELLTAPADSASAAATVSSASLQVGLVGTLVGAAGTPSGVAVVVTVAGVTLTLTFEHFVYVMLLGGFAFICFVIGLQLE